MKKPLNYFGYAFKPCKFSKDYLKTKSGKNDFKRCKKRNSKLQKELKTNGFDSSETWSLDNTIAKFTLPRLKYFRKNLHSYPPGLTIKKWKKIIDSMIFSLEEVANEYESAEFLSIKDMKTYNKKLSKGLKNFGLYFSNLWD